MSFVLPGGSKKGGFVIWQSFVRDQPILFYRLYRSIQFRIFDRGAFKMY